MGLAQHSRLSAVCPPAIQSLAHSIPAYYLHAYRAACFRCSLLAVNAVTSVDAMVFALMSLHCRNKSCASLGQQQSTSLFLNNMHALAWHLHLQENLLHYLNNDNELASEEGTFNSFAIDAKVLRLSLLNRRHIEALTQHVQSQSWNCWATVGKID